MYVRVERQHMIRRAKKLQELANKNRGQHCTQGRYYPT